MASLLLKACNAKPRLNAWANCRSTSPRNITLINQSGIPWPSTRKVPCPVRRPSPLPPKRRGNVPAKTLDFSSPKRCPGLKIILSFLLLIIPPPHPSSYKNISFLLKPLEDPPRCYRRCCSTHESLNKANQALNLLGSILFFNTPYSASSHPLPCFQHFHSGFPWKHFHKSLAPEPSSLVLPQGNLAEDDLL